MLKYQIEDLSCQIATLIHNRFLIEAYGINNCNINYKEGDLLEKLMVKTILDFGRECKNYPKCYTKVEFEDINVILKPKRNEC